jgi:uncharacterized YccA/Bax inhibitor family protein
MRSGNPALREETFARFGYSRESGEVMTVQGVVFKTILLLLIAAGTAVWTWMNYLQGHFGLVTGAIWVGMLGGLVVAFATVFKMSWAPITAPLYAALEGLFLGGISVAINAQYPGIAVEAIGLTMATLMAMMIIFQSGLIKVNDSFRSIILSATFGIAIFYFIAIILSMFGINISLLTGNGWVSIGFSVFVVAIAAFNLLIDFDFITQGANRRAPKYMEWYGAFALMVTLVWLYLEILRLLAKVRSR